MRNAQDSDRGRRRVTGAGRAPSSSPVRPMRAAAVVAWLIHGPIALITAGIDAVPAQQFL